MNYSILNTPNLVEFHGNTQILILSNSRELKRSIYADQNQSALRIHHSEFACLRATHRQAAGVALYAQMAESAKLDEVIRHNLKGLGYGE
jgi:hypothetical protein